MIDLFGLNTIRILLCIYIYRERERGGKREHVAHHVARAHPRIVDGGEMMSHLKQIDELGQGRGMQGL